MISGWWKKGWERNRNRKKNITVLTTKTLLWKGGPHRKTLSIKRTLRISVTSTEDTVSKESYEQLSPCCHQTLSRSCGFRHRAASSVPSQAPSAPERREVVLAFPLLHLPLKASLFLPSLHTAENQMCCRPLNSSPSSSRQIKQWRILMA